MDKEPSHSSRVQGFQGMWLLDTETSIFTPTLNLHTQQQEKQELNWDLALASCIMDDDLCYMILATFALMITA